MVGPNYRVSAANSAYYFYILGEMITILIAYFIRDYQTFYIIMSALLSMIALYYWFGCESYEHFLSFMIS